LDYFSPVRSNEQRWVSGASCSAELKVQSAVAEVVEDQSNALTLVVGSSSIDTATPTAIWLEKNMIEPHRHFQLHANDMRVLSNRGGGNCFFHALRQGLRSLACDGQKLDHIELRQKIVDHARSNLDQTLHTSSGNQPFLFFLTFCF
jgi:hypothetical protein